MSKKHFLFFSLLFSLVNSSANATLYTTTVQANAGEIINLTPGDVVDTTNAIGLLSSGNNALINAPFVNVTTNGINAHGLAAFNGGNISFSDGSVLTQGAGASALAIFSSNGVPNIVTINHAKLFSVAGPAIVAANVQSTIDFLNASTVSSDSGLLLAATNADLDIRAYDKTELLGNVIVSGGSVTLRLQSLSTWTGAAQNLTNLVIGPSTWNISGNSNISDTLFNYGEVVFTPPNLGNYKTLTIGRRIIGSGDFTMNAFLAGDFSRSDLIVLDGATVVATKDPANIIIRNSGGGGALTTGNGILLVQAINGGITFPNSFTSDPAPAGPYNYTLFRGSIDGTAPNNWYLRSSILTTSLAAFPNIPASALTTVTIPVVTPGGTFVPTTFYVIPQYRPEVSLFTALPSMALLYGRMLMDTLHQRVGDEEQLRCCHNHFFSYSFVNGGWLRLVNQGGHINNGSIFNDGPSFNFHSMVVDMGIDIYHQEHADGSRDHVGITGAVGNDSGDVEHFDGLNAGTSSFDVYSLGAYWSHFAPSDWYLDGIFLANRYMVKTDSIVENQIRPDGNGYEVSLEGGYPFRPFNCWNTLIVEPQAQIGYQTLKIDDTQDSAATIHFERTHSVSSRIGLRLAHTWLWPFKYRGHATEMNKLTIWMRGNVWHESNAESITSFSAINGFVPFSSTLYGNWGQGDLGLTAELSKNVFLYTTVGGNLYFNNNRGHTYNVVAGARFNF